MITDPVQAYWVDLPVCNNWADIGLPEVYLDPDLASFNSAVTQTSATDQNHLVKQAIGVFATADAATRAFHRVTDRTVGCAGQTTAMHLDDGTTQVWSFGGRRADRHRRGVGQTGSWHRSALLHPDPAAGERAAAGQGLPVRQRRARGQRARRCHAEHTGSIAVTAVSLGTRHGRVSRGSRKFVGAIWKMDVMTFVVTSQPGRARSGPAAGERVLTSSSSAALHIAGASLERRPDRPGRPGTRGALLRPARSAPSAGLGGAQRRDRHGAAAARWQCRHRGAGRRRRTVRPTGGRAGRRHRRAGRRPGRRCVRRSPRPASGWPCSAPTRCAARTGSTPAPAIEAMERFFIASVPARRARR